MQIMLLYQALVLPFASKAYACNPDGGGGGGLPSNTTGLLAGNFEKNPKRYQDPVLWVWLEFFFTFKRHQF